MSALAVEPFDDTPLEHAITLAQLGLRVVPIGPGQKYPPLNAWQEAATTDRKTIDNWWTGLYRGYGVGLVMGRQPDGRFLFAVDLDRHDPNADGFETLRDLEAQHGQLPPTVESVTGGGGGHLIFVAPPGVTVSNNSGSAPRLGPGIDLRGQGGQIVVAPTVHPNGQKYAWVDGAAPWDVEIAEAPDWLVELVQDVERPTPPKNSTDPFGPTRSGESAADRLRQTWDWHTELVAAGWTQYPKKPEMWVRPNKDWRDGASAHLWPGGPLVVFSTDAGLRTLYDAGTPTRDGTGAAVSPLAFYAARHHGGDLSAASRALTSKSTPTSPIIVGPTSDDVEREVEHDDDWAPRDIVTIADEIRTGTRQREVPVFRCVTDGTPLFYRGRTHSVFGPPGGGKTWIGASTLAERVKLGEHVLMIDWEDSPDGIAARLVQLGCTPDEIALVDYRNPSTSLAAGYSTLIHDPTPWTFILIDSVGESMATQGIDPNADGDTAVWMSLAKSLTKRIEAPAVLLLDHIPKANDKPAAMAIGSQRKLAAITGASYRCDTIVEPARGKPGKLKLVVTKDRLGNRAKGTTAAEVNLVDEGDLIDVSFTISEAQAAVERGEKFRPTVLMEKVSRWLEHYPGASQNKIIDSVGGNKKALRAAIEVLIDEGYVAVDKGARGALEHHVVTPFHESSGPLGPTSPHLAPTSPMDPVKTDLAHLVRPRPDGHTKTVGLDQVGAVEDDEYGSTSPIDEIELF